MKKAPQHTPEGLNTSDIIAQISKINKAIVLQDLMLTAKIFFIVMAIMAALIAVLAWIARAI